MNHQFQGNQHVSIKRSAGKLTVIFVIVISLLLAAVFYFLVNPRVVVTPPITIVTDISSTTYAAKINSLEQSVVESVRSCESAGHSESDGLITFDSNHIASIGTLQFQVHTVIYYEKLLYGKTVTGKDAIEIALDNNESGQLAQDIMFKTPNLATDWLNCSNKLSLQDEILAIKKIN